VSAAATRVRATAKLAAHHLGMLALLRRARRRGRSLIVRYHAVAPDDAPVAAYASPDITIPRGLFAAQMRFLARAYTPVPLATVVDALGRGVEPPGGTVVVTLDDGYADNYDHAFPVLRDTGVPATVYVATEAVDGGPALWTAELRASVMLSAAAAVRVEIGGGHEFPLDDHHARHRAVKELTNILVPVDAALRRRILTTIRAELGLNGGADLRDVMLSSEQIREMHDGGIAIGAHTQTHSNMTIVTPEQARADIGGSREYLEDVLGAPVRDFAYPNTGGRYPHYNPSVADIVRQLGFRSAVTSHAGVVGSGSHPFMLPRIGVSPRLYREAPLAVELERYRLLG
jgi:peptidoglycan/xylan/chitin deacetylase (PgdA/CDA1 family)